MQGTQPPAHSRKHALYRFYADDGALLYVGITLNPTGRWNDHRHDKPWWTDVADIKLETYPDRICQNGHYWTCGWGHNRSGNAPENARCPIQEAS